MMWPYFAMVGVPAIVALFSKKFCDRKLRNRLTIVAFFLIWFILLCLRHEKVGVDVLNYHLLFKKAYAMSFGEIFAKSFSGEFELSFFLLSKIVAMTTGDFRVLLVIIAAISIVPVFLLYFFSARENAYLSIVIFLSLGLFSIYFSALRQVMAVAFAVPAFYFTKNKKLLLFLLMVLLAFTIHHSSVIMLLMYPVYHLNMRLKSNLLILIPIIALVYVFRVPIFEWISVFFNDFYSSDIKETGAVLVFVLLLGFLLLSYIFADNSKLDKETIGLRNLLFLCTLLQIFSGINPIAMRMNYYFLIFVPLLIPRILNSTTEKNKKVALVIYLIMITFFTVWFFYRAYTAEDILSVYPYIPAWAK